MGYFGKKKVYKLFVLLYSIDFDSTLSMFTMIEFINLVGKLLLVSGFHLWALFFVIITNNGCSSTEESFVSSQIEKLRRKEGQAHRITSCKVNGCVH